MGIAAGVSSLRTGLDGLAAERLTDLVGLGEDVIVNLQLPLEREGVVRLGGAAANQLLQVLNGAAGPAERAEERARLALQQL